MKRKSKIRAGWLRFFVLSFIFVFCSSIPAVAQNGIKITGKIVDNTQMEVIIAKLLQKSEMRKDIVIELSYKGFG